MKVIKKKEWFELQSVWNDLIDKNPIATPFQSYEFLTLTGKGRPRCNDVFRTIGLHELNLVLYSDNVPIAIAPLLYKIKKGKATVYFRGHFTGANQLDLIYSNISYDDFVFLMDGIRKLLGNVSFFLDRVYCKSPTSDYLKKYLSSAEIQEHECYAIHIPKKYDDWYNGLHKSRREKYRQIKNRVAKDNVQCTTSYFVGEKIDSAIQKEINLVYVDRYMSRCKYGFGPFKCFVKKAMQDYLKKDKMSQWLNHTDDSFHVIVYMNHEIAAFANGVICKDKRMLGSRLAMNMKFSRYTPGAVLFSSMISYLSEQNEAGKIDIEYLDMGQGGHGNMAYKATYGGEVYHNYTFIE